MSDNKSLVFPDFLQGIRFGIITVFGVLLPGVWFLTSTVFYYVSLRPLEAQASVLEPLASISIPYPLWWIVGFVVCYVAGSQLRALSPNPIDRLSIRWRHFVDGKWLIDRADSFPYRSLPKFFRTHNMPKFAKFVPWDDEAHGETCSTLFVNYSKLYVANKNPRMGDFLDREEAFIRAMSGVAWGTIISTIIGVGFVLWAACDPPVTSWCLFSLVLGVNILVFLAVVMNFHRQRLRELCKVIGSLYLMCHDYQESDPPYG